MIVRGIDAEGDFLFGKGRNDYKRDNDAIGQNLVTRLRSFLGDCFFDVEAGLDWYNLLGFKNQLAVNLAVRTAILNTEGITKLIELSMVLSQNRNLTITYSADTVYSTSVGTVEVAGA
jgi:hypothetical protein